MRIWKWWVSFISNVSIIDYYTLLILVIHTHACTHTHTYTHAHAHTVIEFCQVRIIQIHWIWIILSCIDAANILLVGENVRFNIIYNNNMKNNMKKLTFRFLYSPLTSFNIHTTVMSWKYYINTDITKNIYNIYIYIYIHILYILETFDKIRSRLFIHCIF